jgi:hypothetical protein
MRVVPRKSWVAGVVLASSMASAAAPPDAPPPPPTLQPAEATSGLVQGTVILKRHVPVVGAAVVIRAEGPGDAIDVTSTDSKGAFRVEGVPDGSYRLEILREGFKTVVKDSVVVRAPFRAVVEIVMEPDASPASEPAQSGATAGAPIRVTGSAIAHDNGTKADVRVRLARSGADEPRTVLTDPDGKFTIDGLTAGYFRLEVLGAGYIPIRVGVDLRADSRITATLVPQPPNYAPAPADLLPPEEPIPPPAG